MAQYHVTIDPALLLFLNDAFFLKNRTYLLHFFPCINKNQTVIQESLPC